MKKNKKAYLRINDMTAKKSLFIKNRVKLSSFWKSLLANELSISAPVFIYSSIGCGLLMYIIYLMLVKSQLIALAAGIASLTIPYLLFKTKMMLSKTVDDAMSYKEFVTVLQSALRSNNSTSEVINAVANETNLAKPIRKIMLNASANLRLGDSIEEVLRKAASQSNEPYFKMAMTILRINHDVGASTTINALDNIQKAMDDVIDNTQLLRDKIGGMISDKSLFLVMLLIAPIIHNFSAAEVTSMFYSQLIWQLVYCVIILFAFAGQFLMEYQANKTIKNL